MNVTLTSLEALILKATFESLIQPDAAAVEAFCAVMRDSNEGPQLAAQALAARIHSPNAREALLALTMLDRCMRRSDAVFHAEVGKFRFLNEMIKLVSPKYFADRTAPEVRTRILQLLHAWSIEYPKETKFKVAFEMLKNQGVVKETPPPLPPEGSTSASQPRAKSAIFEDEEKSKLLQKLLQSKKPEDLQHANRLIKTMVREVERQSEANSRRAQEVNSALDSAGLLSDMLDHAENASADEEQLIDELYSRCIRLRPVLQRLAPADTKTEDLTDIIHANDVLDDVFDKYNKYVDEKMLKRLESKSESQAHNESLLDFAGANARTAGDKPKNGSHAVIDELGDIFSHNSSTNNIVEPLKPVNLMPSDDTELLGEKNKVEGWQELDSLGEQLLKQSLPENAKRLENFNNKNSKKIPMNALEKSSPKQEIPTTNNNALLDLDFFTEKNAESAVASSTSAHYSTSIPSNDDVMVDISSDNNDNTMIKHLNPQPDSPLDNMLDLGIPLEDDTLKKEKVIEGKENKTSDEKDRIKTSEVKPLTDINLTLQSVHPSKIPPLKAMEEEEGLSVVLHFCKDKPRPDVSVIVISTTSKSSSPIDDYKFQAIVPKGCKVRLLTASGSSLPAYNPFLPPPALAQLMLVAAPPGMRPELRFVLTYCIDDETCSEMGHVSELPLPDLDK